MIVWIWILPSRWVQASPRLSNIVCYYPESGGHPHALLHHECKALLKEKREKCFCLLENEEDYFQILSFFQNSRHPYNTYWSQTLCMNTVTELFQSVLTLWYVAPQSPRGPCVPTTGGRNWCACAISIAIASWTLASVGWARLSRFALPLPNKNLDKRQAEALTPLQQWKIMEKFSAFSSFEWAKFVEYKWYLYMKINPWTMQMFLSV